MLTVSADASVQARLTASEEGLGRGDATKMQSDVMRPSGSELQWHLLTCGFSVWQLQKNPQQITRTTGAAQSLEIAAVSEIFE